MFSSQDYQKYFEEIAIIERKMVYKLKPLLSASIAPEHLALLESVWQDEIRHYAYARSVLMEILKLPKNEKRKSQRELFLGDVELREIESGKTYSPKLIDFSADGAGLEFDGHAPEDVPLEISIYFYNDQPSVSKRGRIVWKRKVNPGLGIACLAGLEFDADTSPIS